MGFDYQSLAESPIDALKAAIVSAVGRPMNKNEVVAFALTPMKGMPQSAAAGVGGNSNSLSASRIAKYKFKAQIVDENYDLHATMFNVCEIAQSGDVESAKALISCFTDVIIFEEPSAGMTITVNPGDLVLIALDAGAANPRGNSKNLQIARFVAMGGRVNSPLNPLAQTSCQTLIKSFPNSPVYSYSGGGGRPKIADYIGPSGPAQVVINGQFPQSLLRAVDPTYSSRPLKMLVDVVDDYNGLAKAYFNHFGEKIHLTDAYRSFETQVRLKAKKPRLAATPGTSNHGWGVAIDWGSGGFKTERYKWMFANAPSYGFFHNPKWAQKTGGLPEPWHFESQKRNQFISNIRKAAKKPAQTAPPAGETTDTKDQK
tara:strand:+ start:304 stop:1419 length:1116 start_codon:yes stop_codon:yes gene_type:complete